MTGLNPVVQIGSMLIGILSHRVTFCVFSTANKKLLAINLAYSSRTGEYWPLDVLVQSFLLRPRTNFSRAALALGQFSSVLANGVEYISLGVLSTSSNSARKIPLDCLRFDTSVSALLLYLKRLL